MTPEISEFSYGFALTNELVGWTALKAAPIFPSLIEEGKRGGGYDVKLDAPGKPLYLQFKRAHCMTRGTAREISTHKLGLHLPFYRFAITERNRSFQHTSLYELDDGSNHVFYAAPRFHTMDEINTAWNGKLVAQRSVFVSPRDIGLIHDDDGHTVSYDDWHTYFCSEPKEIKALSVNDLHERLSAAIKNDSRTVRDQLNGWLRDLKQTQERARETQHSLDREIEARRFKPAVDPSSPAIADLRPAREGLQRLPTMPTTPPPPPPPPPPMTVRVPNQLPPERAILRRISDEATQSFNAQFFIVQPVTP